MRWLLVLLIPLLAACDGIARPPIVSRDHFEKITVGMDYAEVVNDVIGRGPTDRIETTTGGAAIEFDTWTNADGTWLKLDFRDRKVSRKTQSGL